MGFKAREAPLQRLPTERLVSFIRIGTPRQRSREAMRCILERPGGRQVLEGLLTEFMDMPLKEFPRSAVFDVAKTIYPKEPA